MSEEVREEGHYVPWYDLDGNLKERVFVGVSLGEGAGPAQPKRASVLAQVVELVKAGEDNKTISSALGISTASVASHKSRAKRDGLLG